MFIYVYESTGAYSTILEHFSKTKNIKCFKVGAYQSASFSKVIKNRNKTDIDSSLVPAVPCTKSLEFPDSPALRCSDTLDLPVQGIP